MLSFEQCFFYFPLLLVFVVGGLGFEFCVFVAGWRHALRSEWPFIIIIIITLFGVGDRYVPIKSLSLGDLGGGRYIPTKSLWGSQGGYLQPTSL